MVDWDFTIPGDGPIMSQIPRDFQATLARFDDELPAITSALELEYRLWQQTERPDED
jgi:hypothetical protein